MKVNSGEFWSGDQVKRKGVEWLLLPLSSKELKSQSSSIAHDYDDNDKLKHKSDHTQLFQFSQKTEI